MHGAQADASKRVKPRWNAKHKWTVLIQVSLFGFFAGFPRSFQPRFMARKNGSKEKTEGWTKMLLDLESAERWIDGR
jgi:hypothetical protein